MKRVGLILLVAVLVVGTGMSASAQVCNRASSDMGISVLDNLYHGGAGGVTFFGGLAIKGSTLFRLEGNLGLTSYDITDPVNPTVIGELALAGSTPTYDFAASSYTSAGIPIIGNTLVVGRYSFAWGTYRGLTLVDISDPTNMHVSGFIEGESWCFEGGCDDIANYLGTELTIENFTTDGTYLYAGGFGWSFPEDKLWPFVLKYDISNPASPQLVGMVEGMAADAITGATFGQTGLAVGGGKVFFGYMWFTSADDTVGEFRMSVADAATMTTSAKDVVVGPGAGVGAMFYKDGIVYVADDWYVSLGQNKLRMFDTATGTPVECTPASQPSVAATLYSANVIVGDKWYCLDLGNVDEGISYLTLAGCSTNGKGARYTSSYVNNAGGLIASASGKYLYATGYSPGDVVGDNMDLVVLDISGSGGKPVEVARKDGNGEGFVRYAAPSADGSYAYAALNVSTNGIAIFNMAEKAKPKLVGYLSPGHQAKTIRRSGKYLVSGGVNRVVFWETSTNPTNPTRTASVVVSPDGVQEVTPYGQYVYAAVGDSAVHIFDTAGTPAKVATLSLSGQLGGSFPCYGVSFNEGKMVVSCETGGIVVYDITNPLAPVPLGKAKINTPEGVPAQALNSVNVGNYVYVGTFDSPGQIAVVDMATWTVVNYVAAPSTLGGEWDQVRNMAVAADNKRLWIPQRNGYIILDPTLDPINPPVVDSVPAADYCRGFQIADGWLYGACSGSFIAAKDASVDCMDADLMVASVPVGAAAVCTSFGTDTDGADGHTIHFGDLEFSGEDTPTHEFDEAGNYAVTLYAWNRYGSVAKDAEMVTPTPCGTAQPSIDLTSPADGAVISNGATVAASVGDFTLDCAAVGGANVAGHGHWHILVDGDYDSYVCGASGPLAKNYDRGTHIIKVVLVNNDHTPLSPEVSDSVAVTVTSDTTYSIRQAIPGVARAQGVGTAFFRSSVWAVNTSTEDTMVRLQYVPAKGQTNGGASDHVDVTIHAKGQLAYDDILTEAFGANANTAGVIVVWVADGKFEPAFTARTYNDTDNGTFGQYIEAVDASASAPAPNALTSVWLHGLGGDADNRTNVGVVNLTGAESSATLTVYNDSGAMVGSPVAITIPAWSGLQTNRVNEAAGAGNLDVFSVKISSETAFASYASKLDNVTSDPIFIPDFLEAMSQQWIDGIASAEGAGGTFFRSNLSLTNPGTSEATATISFTKRGESTPSGSASVTLAAGETEFNDDVLAERFSMTGAGMFSISSNVPIFAWARTYNDMGAAGTFGQFIPGFGAADLIGTNGALLQGLSENADFRANLGLVNTSAAAVDVTVSVWSEGGQNLGSKTYSIPASSALFKGRVMNEILSAVVNDGYLKVTPSAAGAVYAWVSYVDNHSTDQTFVRPIDIE